MNMYLVHSTAPEEEHIDMQIICANNPHHAFKLWGGFYGFGWPCRMNLLCPVAEKAQVMPWTMPIRFDGEDPTMVIGTVEPDEE
jgi:hypothetical protein